MSSYTMQLREYIEMWSQYEDIPIREQIEKGREKLFDFDYPIFDEDYRKVFETNIIRKFYTREIGFETEGLFKFQLETWLNINMPYYNRLYEVEKQDYNPLLTKDIKATRKNIKDVKQEDVGESKATSNTSNISEGNSKSKGNDSQNGFNRNITSNTPDTRLKLESSVGKSVIEYASEIVEDSNTNKNTNESELENTSKADLKGESMGDTKNESKLNEISDYVEHIIGKDGDKSYGQLINEFRSSLMNVDKIVHKAMNELFMLVY